LNKKTTMFKYAKTVYNNYLNIRMMIINIIIIIYDKIYSKKKDIIIYKKPSPGEIEELEKKIEMIKIRNNEHEMNVRKYEHEIKMIDAYNKQFEYKIKLVETKGKILSDCLAIIKEVMGDVKCLET
jgi:hypothetical protein